MRQPKTDIPGLVLNKQVAFMPADIDSRYGRDNLPGHGDLLANLVRWAAGDSIPLEVLGRGPLDCNVYTQPGRIIMIRPVLLRLTMCTSPSFRKWRRAG